LTKLTELAAQSSVTVLWVLGDVGDDAVDDVVAGSLVSVEAVLDVLELEEVSLDVVDADVVVDSVVSVVVGALVADSESGATSTRGSDSAWASVVTLGPSRHAVTPRISTSERAVKPRRHILLDAGDETPSGARTPQSPPIGRKSMRDDSGALGYDPGLTPTVAAVDNVVAAEAPTRLNDEAAAQRMFSTAMLVSGVRCFITYLLLPFVAPAVGLATSIGPGVGLVVGIVAISANVVTIQRFHAVRHRWRWAYTSIAVCVIGLLLVLLVRDVSALV
jgi:hypothetical protein